MLRDAACRSAKVLVMLVMLAASTSAQGPDPERRAATRSEVFATHGIAATAHPLATQVALDVLRAGGNAVDAAIAANALLCLVEPTGAGVGGDLFALVWEAKTRTLHGLNGSGRSPRRLTLAQLRERAGGDHIPERGALPISVPGCVEGWCALHARLGSGLPLAKVLAPAIRYAREGAPIPPVIAAAWERGGKLLQAYPNFRETFLPDGRAPRAGEVFRNPGLARTLEQVATRGRAGFYEGEVARTIADHVQGSGGFLDADDLAAHRSEWVEPISTTYRGYRVFELPPNGQGLAVLQMLNVLERFDVAAMGPNSAEWLHLFVETKKLVYEDRARLYADPAFVKVPVARLNSKEYAAERSKQIDPKRARFDFTADPAPLEKGDTTYLTVADQDGNMVSLIQSNYRGMGSGVTPPGLGFVLQNRGELFTLADGQPNTYAPGKRPFHTIIPAFVTRDGAPFLSFGVMGGAMQPQGHVQILVDVIDFGMSLQQAGDAPRIRHEGSSDPTGGRERPTPLVLVEPGFPAAALAELRERGHEVRVVADDGYGGYQAIGVKNGVWVGASESRKDGHAAGY